MEFIKEGATLPVPLNVVPTPSSIVYFMKQIFCYFSKNSDSGNTEMNASAFHKSKPNGHAKKGDNGESLTYKVYKN